MGAVRQNVIFAGAIFGAVAASQLPEFAQQYRQRIGGAIEELRRVVADFDRDATANGLDRQGALDMHRRAAEPLFRDRGRSMEASVARLEALSRQEAEFGKRSGLEQPLLLAEGDPQLLRGTWRDFQPAVPTTLGGLGWAAGGFGIAALLLHLLMRLTAASWRGASRRLRRSRPSTAA